MNRIQNEKGYALLLVLLMVVLFTIMGMGLLAMNMNAAKQFNLKEEQVQARHQAEMGLLHYKSEVEKSAKNFKFKIDKSISIDENLKKNVKDMCDLISNGPAFNKVNTVGNKYYKARMIDNCGLNANKLVVVKVSSEGKVEKTSEIVEGTIELTPPTIKLNNEAQVKPVKPVSPPNYQIDRNWDEFRTIPDYTEINGPFSSKKDKYHFLDSFVINAIPDNYTGKLNDTLQINGGSSDVFIVDKNFYIDGNLHIQNHGCIFVKGDLTINGPLYLGTQSKIVVFGNAYIKGPINYQGTSGMESIKVGGKANIASDTTVNQYNWSSGVKFGSCGWPTNWPNPDSAVPEKPTLEWTVGEKMNPVYLK